MINVERTVIITNEGLLKIIKREQIILAKYRKITNKMGGCQLCQDNGTKSNVESDNVKGYIGRTRTMENTQNKRHE